MKIIKKNIVNTLFIVFLIVVIFVPDAKAFLIRGIIGLGFYAPSVETPATAMGDLSGIRFKDVKGKVVDLGDLKGKVIFLNFWATWCPPCRAEMPSIKKLFTQFKDDDQVVFIFADADANLPKATKFMIDREYNFPVYQVESAMPKQIFESALPTTVVFDKQGRLSFRHEGIANYNDKKFVGLLNQLKSAK
ncbi:TlpA family protein disulfide reductase [Pedobacter sandarakinus]|uniref:TlpA family protein disulfide reductase n=1 Tax=Pedobacter sandarakinus TaxID=353156 RepID=UPI0022479890|nr:TlpA disulfide reductase family protein [Pedobacter sandarakinus]MCX2573474.1 TlpA disulfide reductase family protein [Pedobacter sandarakinus]